MAKTEAKTESKTIIPRDQLEGPWVRTAKGMQSYVLDPQTAIEASGFVPMRRGTAVGVPTPDKSSKRPPSRWRP